MRRLLPLCLITLIACGPFFYQAPPPLNQYPERIASKKWTELLHEAAPLDPAMPQAEELNNLCRSLPERLKPMDTAARLAEVDRLLELNRSGSVYSSLRANLLHEIRELASDSALFDQAADYLSWRVQVWPSQVPATFENDSMLRPYWLVRIGAGALESARYRDAMDAFSKVIAEFPEHPRAEVARLMLGRIYMVQATSAPRADEEALYLKAEEAFTDFINRYPHGRFTSDAHGWLGGIAFNKENYGLAIKHQVDRLKSKPTREVTRTVLRECDMIFAKVLEEDKRSCGDEEIPWFHKSRGVVTLQESVASHPLIIKLFLQHCLDPSCGINLREVVQEDFSADRKAINFLKRRVFRSDPRIRAYLQQVGWELSKHSGSSTDQTTLTLLAWSATESEEYATALALLNQVPDALSNDETLYAKGIVLQRMNQHRNAVVAFDALSSRYPDSPLLKDISYRKSISLSHIGQSGQSVLLLTPPRQEYWSPIFYPEYFTIQLLDTFTQFANLNELEAEYKKVSLEEPRAQYLRNAIFRRLIAKHAFQKARHYLPQQDETKDNEYDRYPLFRPAPLQWETDLKPLADLYDRLAKAKIRKEIHQLHLVLAQQWMAQRGKLTLPMERLIRYALSEDEKQDLLRRQNALQMGFNLEAINAELDRRDEATHALEHALIAAKSTSQSIAAPALELANQCLFRRAEFSLYQRTRAIETNTSLLSRDLYQQLLTRFPDSPEARRAVYFVFQPPTGPWLPGDRNPSYSANLLIDALDKKPFEWRSYNPDRDSGTNRKLFQLLGGYTTLPEVMSIGDLKTQLQASRKELDQLRSQTDEFPYETISKLDDLTAVASLPGVTLSDFKRFAGGSENLPPIFDSILKYRKCMNLEQWQDFLVEYPDSPMAEYASFQITRHIARASRSRTDILACHFPEAPVLDGYKCVKVVRDDPSVTPQSVLAAIQAHETRFPNERFRDDLNLLKAGALIDTADFKQALPLLVSILGNPAQRDLYYVASQNLADLSQRLLDPLQRAQVAAAYHHCPEALPKLKLLVEGDTFLARLKPLMPWLENSVTP